MSKEILNAGSVVKMKSGGPCMTIVSIDGEEAICRWLTSNGSLKQNPFPLCTIEMAVTGEQAFRNALAKVKDEREK